MANEIYVMQGGLSKGIGIEKEVTFELSKTETIRMTATFNEGDFVGRLVKKIQELQEQIDDLRIRQKVPTTEATLHKDWDNDYDERWNSL